MILWPLQINGINSTGAAPWSVSFSQRPKGSEFRNRNREDQWNHAGGFATTIFTSLSLNMQPPGADLQGPIPGRILMHWWLTLTRNFSLKINNCNNLSQSRCILKGLPSERSPEHLRASQNFPPAGVKINEHLHVQLKWKWIWKRLDVRGSRSGWKKIL